MRQNLLAGIKYKKGTEVLSQFAYELHNEDKRGSFWRYPKERSK